MNFDFETLTNDDQGIETARRAREKGIPALTYKEALNDGSLDRLLDDLVDRANNIRIYQLSVSVDQSMSWKDSIAEVGKIHPGEDDRLFDREITRAYPPRSEGMERVNIVLRNFPKREKNAATATHWAEANGLIPGNPRECFAVARYPNLLETLSSEKGREYYIDLAEPTGGGYHGATCLVYVRVTDGWSNVRTYAHHCFHGPRCWFVFRKP